MTTESTATPAQQIAAGYAVEGQALELGTVVVDGTVDPGAQVRIPLATVNRHGLIAGATGTGKTKTLQVMAEQVRREHLAQALHAVQDLARQLADHRQRRQNLIRTPAPR